MTSRFTPKALSKPQITLLRRRGAIRPGGIETHGRSLTAGLNCAFNVHSIAWAGPHWLSLIYTPFFYARTCRNGSRLVHCEDAVTALIGGLIKSSTGKALVSTLHGRDLIFALPWYQRRLRAVLKRHSALVCVSRATARAAVERGCDPDCIEVIPNAAEQVPQSIPAAAARRKIRRQTGIGLDGKRVLLSLGRPVRRKGFDRFIETIFPYLPTDTVYIVAGPAVKEPAWVRPAARLLGPHAVELGLMALGQDTIHDRLIRLADHPRVFYLNQVSDTLRNLLFFASDIFVMPNRFVKGDMEGFGIVALEAAVRGIPVVATGIEGIVDAVHEGENGTLTPEGDPAAAVRIIRALLADNDRRTALGYRARRFTAQRFAPEKITDRYVSVFKRVLESPLGATETKA